jgi:hypothetical protein
MISIHSVFWKHQWETKPYLPIEFQRPMIGCLLVCTCMKQNNETSCNCFKWSGESVERVVGWPKNYTVLLGIVTMNLNLLCTMNISWWKWGEKRKKKGKHEEKRVYETSEKPSSSSSTYTEALERTDHKNLF